MSEPHCCIKKMEKNRTDPGLHHWFTPKIRAGFTVDSMHMTFGEVFSIFSMQHWGERIIRQGISWIGILLFSILPATAQAGYLDDLVELRGDQAYRNAIIDRLGARLGAQGVGKVLERMDQKRIRLEGYEQSIYDLSSKETRQHLQALVR